MWGVSTDTRWGCSAAWVTAAASNDSITKIFLIIISFWVIVRLYILIVFAYILILFTDIQMVFTEYINKVWPERSSCLRPGQPSGQAQGPNFLQS